MVLFLGFKMSSRPKKRRWFAISLRTFFLVLTLFCIWLGMTVHDARRQEQIVNLVHELGGQVEYDYEWDSEVRRMIDHAGVGGVGPAAEAAGPRWLRGLIGDHYFCNVVTVSLRDNPKVTDEVVAQIGQLSELRILQFQDCPNVTDAGIRQLPTSLRLRGLSLIGTACSDAAVAHLVELEGLEQLYLHRTNVTDACLQHLQEVPNLEILGIEKTAISDATVEELQNALPGLRIER